MSVHARLVSYRLPHRFWRTASVVLATALLAPTAFAEDVPWPPEAEVQPKGHEHATWLKTRIETMVQRLALPKAKADKIRRIVDEQLQSWQTKQQQFPPGSQERLQARRQTSHQIEDRIHALLTCEEREKYRLLRREMLEARQDRRALNHSPTTPPKQGGSRPTPAKPAPMPKSPQP